MAGHTIPPDGVTVFCAVTPEANVKEGDVVVSEVGVGCDVTFVPNVEDSDLMGVSNVAWACDVPLDNVLGVFCDVMIGCDVTAVVGVVRVSGIAW